MAKYYCKMYILPVDAHNEEDDKKRLSHESIVQLRKNLIWQYENGKKTYLDVFGKEFMYFHNPVKIYDRLDCKGKPIGILILSKDYFVWKTNKGYYVVKKNGELGDGVR